MKVIADLMTVNLLLSYLEFERSSRKCPRGWSENFVFLDRAGPGTSITSALTLVCLCMAVRFAVGSC